MMSRDGIPFCESGCREQVLYRIIIVVFNINLSIIIIAIAIVVLRVDTRSAGMETPLLVLKGVVTCGKTMMSLYR